MVRMGHLVTDSSGGSVHLFGTLTWDSVKALAAMSKASYEDLSRTSHYNYHCLMQSYAEEEVFAVQHQLSDMRGSATCGRCSGRSVVPFAGNGVILSVSLAIKTGNLSVRRLC